MDLNHGHNTTVYNFFATVSHVIGLKIPESVVWCYFWVSTTYGGNPCIAAAAAAAPAAAIGVGRRAKAAAPCTCGGGAGKATLGRPR